jgi:hypothetical protein
MFSFEICAWKFTSLPTQSWGLLMNDELERMWKEAEVVFFEGTIPAFAWRDRGKPRKPLPRIVGFLAVIPSCHLKQTRCRLSSFLGIYEVLIGKP